MSLESSLHHLLVLLDRIHTTIEKHCDFMPKLARAVCRWRGCWWVAFSGALGWLLARWAVPESIDQISLELAANAGQGRQRLEGEKASAG